MRLPSGRVLLVVASLAAAMIGAGCTNADDTPGAHTPPTTSDHGTTTTAGATASPTPAPTGPELPHDCGRMIDYITVVDAAGGSLEGETTFVFAGPLPSGRTGRITCGYGVVPGPDGVPSPPKIEITLNGYDSSETARFRFDFSIDRARDQGQRIESLQLDGRPTVLLSDAEDTSMIALDEDKTLVVSILAGVVPEPAVKPAMFEIAAAVLDLTPVATPTD